MNFKKIKGFSKYEISEGGIIRNAETKKVLTPEKSGKYVLYSDGDKLKRRISASDLMPEEKKTVVTKVKGAPGIIKETIYGEQPSEVKAILALNCFKWIKSYKLSLLGLKTKEIAGLIVTNYERAHQDIQKCINDPERIKKANSIQ